MNFAEVFAPWQCVNANKRQNLFLSENCSHFLIIS